MLDTVRKQEGIPKEAQPLTAKSKFDYNFLDYKHKLAQEHAAAPKVGAGGEYPGAAGANLPLIPPDTGTMERAQIRSTQPPNPKPEPLIKDKIGDVQAGTSDAAIKLREAREAYNDIVKPAPKSQAEKLEAAKPKSQAQKLAIAKAKWNVDKAQAAVDALNKPITQPREISQANPNVPQPAPLIPTEPATTGVNTVGNELGVAANQRLTTAKLRVDEAQELVDKLSPKASDKTVRQTKQDLVDAQNNYADAKVRAKGGTPPIRRIADDYLNQILQGGNPATPDLIPSK